MHAFDVIRKSVGSEEGMEMMLRLRGLEAVRAHVPSAAPALLACALDVVMTVALDESALGPRFLQQLCCVSWLQSLTEVLLARPPGAARQLDAGFSDVSTQEKVSVILQRISTLRSVPIGEGRRRGGGREIRRVPLNCSTSTARHMRCFCRVVLCRSCRCSFSAPAPATRFLL